MPLSQMLLCSSNIQEMVPSHAVSEAQVTSGPPCPLNVSTAGVAAMELSSEDLQKSLKKALMSSYRAFTKVWPENHFTIIYILLNQLF